MKEFFNPGELLLKENESYNFCYYIISGKVTTSLRNRELVSGEFIGTMSFLTGKPLLESYIANTKVEVLKLDKNSIQQILEEKEFSLFMEHISKLYINLSFKSLFEITPNVYEMLISKARLSNRKDLIEDMQLDETDILLAELDQILNVGEIFESELPEDPEIATENFKLLFDKENLDLAGIIVFTTNYIRKNINNSQLCEDLIYGFEKSIEIEDRALVKYFLYLSCIFCNDSERIKEVLEEYLEILRFWGIPAWGEMLIRVENYDIFTNIFNKKNVGEKNEM
ncbi:Cyclic nucleotide-binding domain-containing protein [Marinitoga hydrogenitolerans DSM 16785]|uniref:Cyclic nucleotide-binding domain-containing protein n=1 Tax=Marinitoga hydrogenitolerans (strain DSM 16785 / JCM 12826 / AT1271) TaxID=1122195 RepID=A0A1M4WYA0_MARH1|nr:cyclic nucleotide-binding domain-containing protein [Marinitoga hydrogenitolerans]SHE86209.1 Cyclic nucleotide-binding domain-containing protein [Marinitoga hydrogenitolerans DSM 16785]